MRTIADVMSDYDQANPVDNWRYDLVRSRYRFNVLNLARMLAYDAERAIRLAATSQLATRSSAAEQDEDEGRVEVCLSLVTREELRERLRGKLVHRNTLGPFTRELYADALSLVSLDDDMPKLCLSMSAMGQDWVEVRFAA